ncbi:hypothetical protein AQUCO_00600189v1 [Aquilegia coerulea]|uniref:Dirigent protein n=1 Tax=Aquilegia coerulea TaxID=218851 RepID=A0A2G5ENL5_AQUCA|nr:hypothetical protein AQUCO_00600189v1 [Aquilegia coerulea]
MIDNALTRGLRAELNSTLLGRTQEFFYSTASQTDVSLLTVMNFVFTTGKYNGSTISILGRNELGSRLFGFARGYVEARTRLFNINNGDLTVEYFFKFALRY